MKQYDVVVVGGGPGGYVAALEAASFGQKTALVEGDFLGGTCLNRGCIPSKTWLKYAEIIESIEKARSWGLETGPVSVSIGKMRERKHEVIVRLRKGIEHLLKQGKIDVYEGWGMVSPDKTVTIEGKGGTEKVYAPNIIIATGSSPVIPPIKGLAEIDYETSDTVFDIEGLPKSVVIVGGGVIGLEFASIFAALDVQVTIVEALERVVSFEEEDASKILTKQLKKKGVSVYVNTSVQEVAVVDGIKQVKCAKNNGEKFTIETEMIILSVGRRPNVSGVSALPLTWKGPYIKVNDHLETCIKGIYAVGDVIGGYQLAHVASAEGVVAVHNMMGQVKKMDYKVVPRCIYSLPEVASVGLTEQQAIKQGLKVVSEKFDLAASGKAVSAGQTEGFVKIVYDQAFGEVIGVTMVGPHVTEMISEASAFMFLEGTIDEMSAMIHPHPTISEAFYETASHIVAKLRKTEVLQPTK